MLRDALTPWHILLVLLVFILLFGARRLPDTARALGKSMRIFKAETRGLREDDEVARAGGPAAQPGQPAQPAQPAQNIPPPLPSGSATPAAGEAQRDAAREDRR